MCQKSLSALREYLNYTQAEMASLLDTSTRTIIRIEMGYSPAPLHVQKKVQALIKLHRPPGIVTVVATRTVDVRRMNKYLEKPGAEWSRWSKQKRAQFWALRTRYKRILAESAAGLCVIRFRYKPDPVKDLGLDPKDLPPFLIRQR